QKSEIRNQKSEIRNQKSEIRNQKSEIRNTNTNTNTNTKMPSNRRKHINSTEKERKKNVFATVSYSHKEHQITGQDR
ncbi:hypothetical protein, partial [Pseudomonas helleri]|uniref:hypothetical protein n=1 Tax=Pseudomonas helleri TaxID=1608996 RepID=UPI001E3C9BA9